MSCCLNRLLLSVRLAGLCLLGLATVLVSESYANPGAVGESRSQEKGVTDPVVERVRAAIRHELPSAVYNIRIVNLSESILLQGEVDSQNTREQMISTARMTAAKSVRDELRLRTVPTDEQVAANIRSALKSEYPALVSRVAVEVREGVAYLSGDLHNHREVDELLATTLMVAGVRDIRSDITLHGRPYAQRNVRKRG